MVTTTLTNPDTADVGTIQVRDVPAEFGVTLVAALPLNVTEKLTCVKFVPVIVTVLPPVNTPPILPAVVVIVGAAVV